MGHLRRCIGLTAAVACAAGAARGQVFEALGYPAGLDSSSAVGISADGTVVAGTSSRPFVVHGTNVGMPVGYRWRAGSGWQALGLDSLALAVSGDGTTILGLEFLGGPNGPGPGRPFSWTQAGGAVFFDPGSVYALSADAQFVVGGRTGGNGRVEAYRWTEAGGYRMLGFLTPGPTMESWGAAVSADGSVVAGTSGDTLNTALHAGFVWTEAGGMRPLGTINGAPPGRVYPRAVSANGRYIVGQALGATGLAQAFVWWEPGGMRPLPLLPGYTTSVANAVSADGSVIVGDMTGPGVSMAFIWDRAKGMRDLRQVLVNLGGTGLTGARLGASGVSANGGTIVGSAALTQGNSGAYIAHIPPFCYANCDGSTIPPVLNVSDFTCFLNRYVFNDSYANCDGSTIPPVLNVSDFICFTIKHFEGCQ